MIEANPQTLYLILLMSHCPVEGEPPPSTGMPSSDFLQWAEHTLERGMAFSIGEVKGQSEEPIIVRTFLKEKVRAFFKGVTTQDILHAVDWDYIADYLFMGLKLRHHLQPHELKSIYEEASGLT